MCRLEGSSVQQNRGASSFGIRQLVEVRIKRCLPAGHRTQSSSGYLTCHFSSSHYRKGCCYLPVKEEFTPHCFCHIITQGCCSNFQGHFNRIAGPLHALFPRPDHSVSRPCHHYLLCLENSDLKTQLFSSKTLDQN